MRIRTPRDIGLAIRERRRALGLDQRSLAERIGVSRQWLVEVEKGKPRAEVGLLLRTLNALHLELRATSEGGAVDSAGAGGGTGGHGHGLPDGSGYGDPFVDIDQVIEKARGKKRGK